MKAVNPLLDKQKREQEQEEAKIKRSPIDMVTTLKKTEGHLKSIADSLKKIADS